MPVSGYKLKPVISQPINISEIRIVILQSRFHILLELHRHVDNLTEVLVCNSRDSFAFLLSFVARERDRCLESCILTLAKILAGHHQNETVTYHF